MCDFHSVVVRRDGAISHVRANSHSKAVAAAGWTENTSAHLPKRFVEVEWNGEGEYPGACQITRYCGNDDLTEKQRKTIDRHYGALTLALKGDASALQYFDDLGPEYQDVLDQVISRASLEDMPKLMAKLFCDSDAINKRVKDGLARGDKGIAEGEKAQASVSGNYGKASVSGNYGQASVSGYGGKASVSGYGGKASVSGDSGQASVSGDSGKASVSGYGGQASVSGDSGKASVSGDSGKASVSGYGGKASVSGDSGKASVSGYGGKASVSGDSGQASVSGNYGQASVSGNYGQASVSGYGGQASVSGEKGLAAVIGNGGSAKAEKNGCIVLTYWDDKADRPRVAVGYVGEEGIEADTWYVVKKGKLVKI